MWAASGTIVVGGAPMRTSSPPAYDFARLPVQRPVVRGSLGPEQPNPYFRKVDTRSVFARHRSLVTAALALAAAVLVAAGALAVRRA